MNDTPLLGLTVDVYRSARWERAGFDGTNGGASSRCESFTVVGLSRDGAELEPLPRDCQVFTPTEATPAAVLVPGPFDGSPPKLVPLDVFESGRWYMCGGNLADTSDWRWRDVVSSFLPSERPLYVSAVEIHDRMEAPERVERLNSTTRLENLKQTR